MISKGDKVSLIDEKLEGIVLEILVNGMVKIETPDGFPIDVYARQLVITEKYSAAANPPVPAVTEVKSDKEPSALSDTITFICSPAEVNKILTGRVCYTLSNGSLYSLLFTFFGIKDDKSQLLHSGILPSGNKCVLATADRDSLIAYRHFTIQFLLAGITVQHPFQRDIAVLMPELTTKKEENISHGNFSKTLTLLDFNEKELPDFALLKDKMETAVHFTSPLDSIKLKKKNRHSDAILINSKEVDLHIESLHKDYKKMNNAEILNLQLATVRQEMDKAIVNHFKKMIFIHGIGNGVLRKAVLEELQHYAGLEIKSAPYEKYGSGAIEVFL
jgi:hypothetical protein